MAETTYTLAGGCFWCLDAAFSQVRGVLGVDCGFCGGHVAEPTYELVCTGTTGHAETVRVRFDPDVLDPDALLDLYFTVHDPTTRDRQGADVGPQYRSVMFWADEDQRRRFETARTRAAAWYPNPIVTEIRRLERFWPAEEEHQDYFAKHPDRPYCRFVVSRKVALVRSRYRDLVR